MAVTQLVGEPQLLRWEELNKTGFDRIDRARAVVLVTCSPLEVHGPHLPMGADMLEGAGLARRMLRFLPERHQDRVFLELPPIYTATDTLPQPGSLFFQPSTTVRVLTELGRTLAAQGFTKVVVSNFHGGPRHFVAIERACARANRRYGLRMMPLFSVMLSQLTGGSLDLNAVLGDVPGIERDDLVGDVHAGLVETAQLLALHGGWVDPAFSALPRLTVDSWLEETKPGQAGAGLSEARGLVGTARSYRQVLRFFERNTYAGAPAGASAEIGERFLDLLGERAAGACAEFLDGTLDPRDCHSPLWKFRFVLLNPLMIRLTDRLLGFRNPLV
ncbi:MAG: creatininase family protein [Candidatus Binatia bacterium]